ncbi:MAG: hypothetical protein LUF85_06300 [Bacteroides sp.]|nr:hypothetical protein [Bacteroides sp.]
MKGKSETKSCANSTSAQGKNDTRTKRDITAQSSTENQANKNSDDQLYGRSESEGSTAKKNSR